MIEVVRGEVFRAKLDPIEGSEQGGTRPVVVVSRNALNRFSPIVIACAITDAANKKKLYPSHVKIGAGNAGLRLDSVVLCEQVRAISKTRLKERLGTVDETVMAALDNALRIVLDLA